MNFSQYTQTHSQAELAKAVNTSTSFLSQCKTGKKAFPPLLCVAIEKETMGAVTRKDLRPDDYWKIWPELKVKRTKK